MTLDPRHNDIAPGGMTDATRRAENPPSGARWKSKWLLWNVIIVVPLVAVLWFFSVEVTVLPFGISVVVDIALIGWTAYLTWRVGPIAHDGGDSS